MKATKIYYQKCFNLGKLMMNKDQVCSECKLFTNEDSFGDGWCEFHQKETFCENEACDDGIEISGDSSLDKDDNDNPLK